MTLCRWKSFYLLFFVFSPTWVQKRPSGICSIPFSLFPSTHYVVRKGHFTPFVQTWTLYITLANGTTEAVSVLPTPSPSASQTALLRVISLPDSDLRRKGWGRKGGREGETERHTQRFVVWWKEGKEGDQTLRAHLSSSLEHPCLCAAQPKLPGPLIGDPMLGLVREIF